MKKKLLIMMAIAFVPFLVTAQTLYLKAPENIQLSTKKADTITLKEPVKDDETVYLIFQVKDRKPGTTLKFKLNDANDGTADRDKDYEYVAGALSEKSINDRSPDYFSVPVIIKADKIKEVNEDFSISILYSDNSGTPVISNLTVIIVDDKDPSKKITLSDTAQWSFRIVTAGNFDFFSGSTFKNYAGDLNLFMPGVWSRSEAKKDNNGKDITHTLKFGFQFGIFNYQYSEADSSNSNIRNESYLLKGNVIRIIPDTTKYIRSIYAMNSKISYNIWGLYLNPMISLGEGNDWAHAYCNLHVEVLIRTQTSTYNQVSLRKDTLTVPAPIPQSFVVQAFPGIHSLYDKTTFYDTYFGIGFPVKVNFKGKLGFYIAPTMGVSSYAKTSVGTISQGNTPFTYFVYDRTVSPFFLFKSQLYTTTGPLDIVLGGEYRSVIGKNNYLTMYLGASLPLDKLIK